MPNRMNTPNYTGYTPRELQAMNLAWLEEEGRLNVRSVADAASLSESTIRARVRRGRKLAADRRAARSTR